LIKINIKKITTGKWKENCYIISKTIRDALIIDPGDDKEKIENYLHINDLKLIAILNTHAHFDHIGAVKYFQNKYNIPFFLHSADEKLLKNANLYMKLFNGSGIIKTPDIDYYYDKSNIQEVINNFKIKIVHTPGHTQGSVCIFINNYLFTGDTLLNGKIGRTDLPGGNKQILNKSLKIIAKMSDKLNIYPGHGVPSTIGNELMFNNEFIKATQ